MGIILDQVVPWGRSFDEYRLMFDLSQEDLKAYILGCGDGPASFNCEMTALGHSVVSIDPLYACSKEQIEQRVKDTYQTLIAQIKQNAENYIWGDYFQDADHLAWYRLATMKKFLEDFNTGLVAHRYLPESLPSLSFADDQFDLALCSHLLFLYSEQLSFDFHLASIQELCRVSREIRLFPLETLDFRKSWYVEPLRSHFSKAGFAVDISTVPYEFQRGANQMMRIYKG